MTSVEAAHTWMGTLTVSSAPGARKRSIAGVMSTQPRKPRLGRDVQLGSVAGPRLATSKGQERGCADGMTNARRGQPWLRNLIERKAEASRVWWLVDEGGLEPGLPHSIHLCTGLFLYLRSQRTLALGAILSSPNRIHKSLVTPDLLGCFPCSGRKLATASC